MAEPQGAFLGSAYGYIDLDSTGAINALNQTKAQFNNFIQSTGSMMQGWGQSIAGFGQNLTLWTAPAALAMGAGLNIAADFDSVLTEIQARTGLTAEAMEQVRQTALQLGADTAFSSQQAADAFLNLLTAGLSVEDALATLPQVLTAAAAGGMDLGTAADLTTSIMASFSLTAADSTAIIDAMSRASAASPASMNEIGIAMKDVGGLAQMFNLSLDETAAVLAIFAQNGIRGAEAGTQLRSLLLNLSSPTEATAKAWDALGTSLYNADGSMRNLDDVLADIRVGLQRLPVEQQNEVIAQLAGSYGIVGFNALLASDGIGAMEASMAEQAAASEVAAQMMASFKGVVDAFKGSMETLWITVMTPYMNNVLRPMIEQKTAMVNRITAWAAANEPLVQTIMQIVSAVLTLGPILVGAGVAMQVIGGALATIGTVAAAVLSPIGLLIAGVAGLAYVFRQELSAGVQIAGYAFAGFQTMFAETGDFVGSAISAINDFILRFSLALGMPTAAAIEMTGNINSAFQTIRGVVGGFVDSIQSAMVIFPRLLDIGMSPMTAFRMTLETVFGNSPVLQAAIAAFGSLRDTVSDTFNRILAVTRPAFTQISIFFQNNVARVGEFIQGFLNITRLFNPIGQLSLILQAFGLDFMTVFEGVMRGITRFFATLNGGGKATDALKAAFGETSIFGGFVDIITNQVMPALEQLRSWFLDTVAPNIGAFITNSLIPSIESFVGILGNLWSIVGPTLLEFGEWFLMTGMPVIMESLERFTNYLANDLNVGEGMRAVADWFLNTALPPIMTFINNTVIPAIQSLITWLGDIWNRTQPGLNSLGNWFLNDVMPQIDGILRNSFMPLIEDVVGWLSDLWLLVQPHLQNLADWFLVTGLPSIQTFITTTILPAVDGFIALLQRIWSDVEPHLTNLANWFFAPGGALDGIINFLQTTVPPIIDGFITLLSDIWTVVSPYLENLWTWFMGPDGALQGIMTWLGTDVKNNIDSFINLLAGIWDAVSPALGDFYNWFMGPEGGLHAIMEFLEGAFTLAVEGVTIMINDMTGFVNDAITAMTELLGLQSPNAQMGGSGYQAHLQATVGGAAGGVLGKIGGFASGIDYVPSDMIALIHQGERIQRANENPYNPNAQATGMGNISFEGAQFNFPNVRSREDAVEAGMGLAEGIMRKLHNSGTAEEL